jgi:trimeric autotransporter adhesin
MKKVLLLSCLLAASALVGCGGNAGSSSQPSAPATLRSLALSPTNPLMLLQVAPAAPATLNINAMGHYSDNSSKDLSTQASWSSSAQNVATVDSTGKVTAVFSGTATITAALGSVSASTTVTVNPQLVSIAVTPAKPQIAKETTQQFTATGSFNDGTHQNLTSQVSWSSSDNNIASVNNSPGLQGLATGLIPGTVTITATSGAISGSAQLNVSNANLVSIAVTPANSTMNLATLQQFTATGTFDDSTTQNISGIVTWSSSTPGVATVTATGLVSAVGKGSTTISASDGSISASTGVTVSLANVTSLHITPDPAQIAIGTNRQMIATATLNDGSTLDVTITNGVNWTSSNTAVATIGQGNGLAVSKSVGPTTISVTFGSQSASTSLDVTAATITSISVAPNNTTIAPGTNQRFTATGTFSDGSTQNITGVSNWASNNSNLATVGNSSGGSKGLATGISQGTANISASFTTPGGPSATGSAALNVSGAELLEVDVAPQNFVVAPATGVQYSATGQFSDGSSQSVTLAANWTSSSTSVAGVSSSGLATGNSPGTTTITATLGSVSGSSNLLVTASPLVSLKITAPNNGMIAQQSPEQLIATGTFADGTNQNVTGAVKWTSSSSSVATVNNGSTFRGVLMAIAPGSTTVTALLNGIVGSADITVTNATITSIAVAPSSSSITLGSSQGFTATANISDGSAQDITRFAKWTSSDPNVAIVSPSGDASTAGTGTTTIGASMNGVTGQAVLTVNP